VTIAALDARVRAALADRSPTAAAAAATALGELATLAFAGDDAAATAYHGLVWDLHADPDHATHALRGWLVQAGYAVEQAYVPVDPPQPALAPADLLARLAAEQARNAGLAHPMSAHMFHGDPSLAELKIYLRHHWHRSRLFYRELTELALTCPLRHASILHRNLYDETGGEHSERAHPFLLQRLLRHFDLPHGFADRPELPEAQAYLNNRIRCARHPNPAWGLAVLYSLEAGTPATHGNIHALLRRFGVPDEAREFHRVHMTADVEHARETAELIGDIVQSPADQAILLASLRYHRALGRRYFDAIWREMQATRRP
jgi:pyrroloquinoline quinone (PQQ) biosynthesis protein C